MRIITVLITTQINYRIHNRLFSDHLILFLLDASTQRIESVVELCMGCFSQQHRESGNHQLHALLDAFFMFTLES